MFTEDIFQSSPFSLSPTNSILALFQIIHTCIQYIASKLPNALKPSYLRSNPMGGFISSSISIHASQNNNNSNEKSFVNNSPKSINLSRSIIWLFGKFVQIWAVFHLYDFLSPHWVLKKGSSNSPTPIITIDTLTKNAIAVAAATYDPNATHLALEKPSMSIAVAGLYTLTGAIMGWIVVENFIRFIIQRYANRISSPVSSHLKEQFQQQDKVESGGNETNAFSGAIMTKLVLHSMWITGSVLLWAYALTVLGPSRVILLQFVEHCIAIFLGHILGWKSSPRAMQSSHILLLITGLLVMIVGRTDDQQNQLQQQQQPLLWTQRLFLIGNTISLQDFIKNAWYLVILLGSLMFTVLRKNHTKRLSVDLRKVNFEQQTGLPGSSFWATISVAGILMTPFIFVNFIMRPGEILVELLSIVDVPRALIYGFCLITIPFYTEQMSQVTASVSGTGSNGAQINDPTMSVVPSLFWRMVWTLGIIVTFFSWQTSAVLLGFLLILKAVSDVTGSQMDRSTPLPSFFHGGGANKQQFISNTRLSNRIANGITMYLQFIMANRDSRYLFIFLVANLLFMFVELAYGIWSNSLGLISDSAHMLFDCAALGVGLYGAFMSKWKRNGTYTYGYSRYEFLSGFVNGILLVFISIYIFLEAFHRVFDPPTIDTHRLLLISVLGFLVNLMGVIFFHQDHDHGHMDENMHGVYLHILADALGSVGVIISTLLMQYFGWFLADPLCSIMISALILMTSYPLISNSCSVLLQRTPSHLDKDISDCIHEVEHIEGVLQVYGSHFWTLSSSVIVGSLHMRVQDHVNEQDVLKKVTELFRSQCNVSDLTVQIEKSGAGSGPHHHHHP